MDTAGDKECEDPREIYISCNISGNSLILDTKLVEMLKLNATGGNRRIKNFAIVFL